MKNKINLVAEIGCNHKGDIKIAKKMIDTLENRRKKQIMDAAQAIVVKKGYDQSRMDDIVKIAQLSKGAIYWYYKSKKDVYLSLIDYWFNEYSEGILENFNDSDRASMQLKSLFNYYLQIGIYSVYTFKLYLIIIKM